MMKQSDDVDLKRDLRLALDQKTQADRLVETLTKRCDSLRSKLVEERAASEKLVKELQSSLAQERERCSKAEEELYGLRAKALALQKELDTQRRRNEELTKVAEAAINEAFETMRTVS